MFVVVEVVAQVREREAAEAAGESAAAPSSADGPFGGDGARRWPKIPPAQHPRDTIDCSPRSIEGFFFAAFFIQILMKIPILLGSLLAIFGSL